MNLQGVPKYCDYLGGVAMFDLIFLGRFFDKNEEFLCSSDGKFPEFFKTHPTFVISPILMPFMAI